MYLAIGLVCLLTAAVIVGWTLWITRAVRPAPPPALPNWNEVVADAKAQHESNVAKVNSTTVTSASDEQAVAALDAALAKAKRFKG